MFYVTRLHVRRPPTQRNIESIGISMTKAQKAESGNKGEMDLLSGTLDSKICDCFVVFVVRQWLRNRS